MARFDFGGTLADFVVTSRHLGGLDVLGLASATLTFWSAQTGGTQYTDLQMNGSATPSIAVASDGQVPTFQGPDSVTVMWADGGSGRVRIVSQGIPGPAGPGATNSDVATIVTTAGGPTDTALRAAFAGVERGLPKSTLAFRKLRGGNITVKPAGNSWPGMWIEWDWANWIKPQVDRAVALGMNAVRVIGAPEAVLVNASASLPKISQATYNARWAQLAAYCISKGLYLYAALCEKYAYETYQTSLGSGAPWNFQNATVTGVITSSAATLATYSNVVGFDLFQEGGGQADGLVVADVLALYAAIRAVAPGVPLTTSNSSGGFGTAAAFWGDTSSLSYQCVTAAGGADFLDLHVYLDGISPSDADDLIYRTGKPVMVGEFGVDQTQTSGVQAARFQSIAALHNRSDVLGSFVWALADQSVTTSDKWGVYDNTGFSQPSYPSSAGETPLSVTSGQRATLRNALAAFNIAATPTVAPKKTNLLRPSQAAPRNVATTGSGWSQGTNTYLFADARGLGFSAIAQGVTSVNTFPATGIAVSGSTIYTASMTIMATAATRDVSFTIDWYSSAGVYIRSAFTTATGKASVARPTTLMLTESSPGTAAYAVLNVRCLNQLPANESLLLVNAQFVAGPVDGHASPPSLDMPLASPQVMLGPTGCKSISLDLTQPISASLGLLVSGTPRATLLPLQTSETLTSASFITGTTAAASPTNWWVALCDLVGNVVAVSANQGTAAIAANTVVTLPFTVPTPVAAGRYYLHVMVAATTNPTVAGVSGSLFNAVALSPIRGGSSTTTGATTPPAVGGTLGSPATESTGRMLCWVS